MKRLNAAAKHWTLIKEKWEKQNKLKRTYLVEFFHIKNKTLEIQTRSSLEGAMKVIRKEKKFYILYNHKKDGWDGMVDDPNEKTLKIWTDNKTKGRRISLSLYTKPKKTYQITVRDKKTKKVIAKFTSQVADFKRGQQIEVKLREIKKKVA